MNMKDTLARLSEISEELEVMDPEQLNEEQEARFDELTAEAERLTADVEAAEARNKKRDEVRERIDAGRASIEPGEDRGVPQVNVGRTNEDPYDLDTVQTLGRSRGEITGELRSRAATAIERHWALDDDQKEAATKRLEGRGDSRFHRVRDNSGFIPEYVLRTGSDTYHEAFHKYMAGRGDLLTDAERRAVANADEIRAAMSLTDANGGYAVPFTLDPSLILTSDGYTNPFRQISRVETITTDSWNGLSSGGVTASYDAELTEVSDNSPTFDQPSVPVHKAQAFAQGTIEITQDYRGLAGDLQMLFAEAKDDLEAQVFATGTGTNQPTGIVTALTGTGSEVASATTDTFALEDVYAVIEGLGPRWRSRSSWLANLSIINDIRQFGTANNYHGFTVDLTEGYGFRILGRPAYEVSAMDGAITGTAENYVAVLGDFRNYLIAERVGMVVEFIPHLFNTTTNLPDGRRGWYAYWRNGADSVNDAAFSMLNVT